MTTDSHFSIAIIGAGASGLACSIELKRRLPGADVFLFDKLEKPGKKILATGNGRCNLSNRDIDISYYNGDSNIISTVLKNFSSQDAVSWFGSLGVMCCEEEGRIYPVTRKAETVLCALENEAKRLGVCFVLGNEVTDIEKNADKFLVGTSDGGKNAADAVVLAAGGKAANVYGTNGDGYRLAKNFGISYVPISPALVQITVSDDIVKSLKGIRVHGRITLTREDGALVGIESGEIQFTDYGVSGIAAMQLSGDIAVLCHSEKPVLSLDFFPDYEDTRLLSYVRSMQDMCGSEPAINILKGALLEPVAAAVFCKAGIDTNACSDSLGIEQLVSLVEISKSFTLEPTGTKGFKNAQVTRGGIGSDELNRDSLTAGSVEGLFFCGEILNVDGFCGGYNLHFAWGSGIEAAKEVSEFAQN